MKKSKIFNWILIGTAFLALIALTIVPAGAVTSFVPGPNGGALEREFAETHPMRSTPESWAPPFMYGGYKDVYTSPDPFKVYGEEFSSPDLIRAGPYSYATSGDDGEELRWYVAWKFEFWLTPEQHAQFIKWKTEDPYMSLLGAMSQLVPEQVAVLPDDLKRYLVDYDLDTIVGCIKNSPELAPTPLYSVVGCEYTDEVKMHLINLGLSPNYETVDLTVATLPWDGEVLVLGDTTTPRATIVMEGNTPDGIRKRWTFVQKVVMMYISPFTLPGGTFWNADEDRLPTEDEYYLLHVLNGWSGPATLPPVVEDRLQERTLNTPVSSRPSAIAGMIGTRELTGSSDTSELLARHAFTRNNDNSIMTLVPLQEHNVTTILLSEAFEVFLAGQAVSPGIITDMPSSGNGTGIQTRENLLSARKNARPEIIAFQYNTFRIPGPGEKVPTSSAVTLLENRRSSRTA